LRRVGLRLGLRRSVGGGLGGLDVDATHVYFTDTGTNDWRGLPNPNGRVRKLPKRGGSITTLSSGLSRPTALLADASHLYFMTWRKPSGVGLADVRRINK
jgi:hypothetical protein